MVRPNRTDGPSTGEQSASDADTDDNTGDETEKAGPTADEAATEGSTPVERADDADAVSRRSVLKATAVTAAAAAGAVGAVGNADAAIDVSDGDGYEVWTVTNKEVYDLSDGEDLSNVLVDQTADGACLTIRSRNKTGWAVRNVGFLGVGQLGDGANRFQIQVSTPSGGYGLIENVWMNGKARDGQAGSSMGGIFSRSSHAGHMDVRHTYIEGYGNNAIYASGPGKDSGNEGSVALENCYHRDNTVSQFRIGTPDSSIRHCVGVVNDPNGDRGTYPWSDSRTARGLWGKHFRDQRIENTAFYVSGDDYNPSGAFVARYISDRSRGSEAVIDSQYCDLNADAPSVSSSTSNATVSFTDLGEAPSVSVLQDGGVPLTAKAAASGDRSMPPELPGTDASPTLSTGSATDVTDTSATLNGSLGSLGGADSADVDFEWRASGASSWNTLAAGTLSSTGSFSASLSSLSAGTEYEYRAVATASDGDSVTASIVVFTAGSGTTLDRTLTVDGSAADRTDYTFTVSGDLAENPDTGGLGSGDSIDGSTASGFVNGGIDGYLFSGEVTDITVTGNADILVDGTVVDPAELDDPDPTISTEAASAVSDTQATLNGTLDSLGEADSADVGFEWRAVGAADWTALAAETRSTTGPYSATVSGLDASTDYEFRATALASDGDAATGATSAFTSADGSTLDRTLTVDGTNADRTDYTFTVSGGLAENPDTGGLGSGDSIDGSTASGFVNGGVDGYLFSGEVTDITVTGNADILVDGTVVDPAELDDTDPTVTTVDATDVTDTQATLNGTLDSLGKADSADVGFEWRAVGAADWYGLPAGSLTQTGAFSASLSELSESSDYEFRATVLASDGDAATGSTAGFTTGTTASLDRTLTVDGSAADRTDYTFTVSGDLAENPDTGGLGSGDSIEGSTASGFVNGGVDGYLFSGEITDITVSGNADILVDGEIVDPDALVLPNTIVFNADASTTETTYSFEVSGDLVNDEALGAIESGDDLSGSTVTGTVAGDDVDGFRFEGDLVTLQIDGDGSVRFEDNDG